MSRGTFQAKVHAPLIPLAFVLSGINFVAEIGVVHFSVRTPSAHFFIDKNK